MDKEAAIGLAKRFSELVSQHIPARHIVLYGSYAKGTARPDGKTITFICLRPEGRVQGQS